MDSARYLDNTYDRTFETTVTRRLDDRIVLEETLFYPDGGGQPHDEGTVSFDGLESRVVHVEKKDEIYHAIEGPVPDEGTVVVGRLDWKRRYAHMQYHTAQHLVSAVLLSEFDARTTGNQIYVNRARIDCEYDRFEDDELEWIENRVNDHVAAARPVVWRSMDRETAEEELDPDRTRLHLLPDSITTVRVVEIEDVDRTACAGTHVRNTEEIGAMSITGRETKGSGEERIRFVLE
ncbi:MAG: alanyl-tRNA editing protein [Halodesulfurarchaeum sp.]